MTLPPFIEQNVRLSTYTSFSLGGPARFFAEPLDMEQLRAAVAFAQEQGVPVLCLGGGTNIVLCDNGVMALVVHLSRKGMFGLVERDPDDLRRLRAGAAVSLQGLVSRACGAGMAGLEQWAGIPGTVGGAVAVNAGPGGRGIGEYVDRVEIMDPASGQTRMLGRDEVRFSSRQSSLDGCIILSAEFVLPQAADPQTLAEQAKECLERKRTTQPLSLPSAGCVFVNPEGDFAGRLIDAAGCKGWYEGGAEVSDVHANFIVNTGSASCCDVTLLAARVRQRVLEKFGVSLRSEIRAWGGMQGKAQRRLLDGECSCMTKTSKA